MAHKARRYYWGQRPEELIEALQRAERLIAEGILWQATSAMKPLLPLACPHMSRWRLCRSLAGRI